MNSLMPILFHVSLEWPSKRSKINRRRFFSFYFTKKERNKKRNQNVPGLRLVCVILSSGNISSSSANCIVSIAPWYLSTSFLKSAAIPVNFPSCKDMFLATSGTVNPRCSRCLTSAKVSDKSVVKLTRYLSAHESGFGGKVRSKFRVKFASEKRLKLWIDINCVFACVFLQFGYKILSTYQGYR